MSNRILITYIFNFHTILIVFKSSKSKSLIAVVCQPLWDISKTTPSDHLSFTISIFFVFISFLPTSHTVIFYISFLIILGFSSPTFLRKDCPTRSLFKLRPMNSYPFMISKLTFKCLQ